MGDGEKAGERPPCNSNGAPVRNGRRLPFSSVIITETADKVCNFYRHHSTGRVKMTDVYGWHVPWFGNFPH